MRKIIKSECKFLKTKKAHIPDETNPDDWRTNVSGTGSYWCVKSMKTTGPDEKLVAPEECQEDRSCFIPLDF